MKNQIDNIVGVLSFEYNRTKRQITSVSFGGCNVRKVFT